MRRLGWRMLLRDWRAGELRVLTLALTLAVMSVSSVGFFADRVRQALVSEAHQLLGADLQLSADHVWNPVFADQARAQGLQVAQAVTFVSMARAVVDAQLVGVKAVSANYPLRGALTIARALNGPDAPAVGIPAPGEVWVDERLLGALRLNVGNELELGELRLRIAAILTIEPDRGMSFFNIAPRLMMNEADVMRSGLIQDGSRATYVLYVAGDAAAMAAYQDWAKTRLGRGEEMQSPDQGRPEIRQTLDRAQQFLALTALLAVMLAAVAIGLATRRYTQRHLSGYAVMRCLGARQRQLTALFAWEFLALGAAAALAGCVLGYAAQSVLAFLLADLVGGVLPQPTLAPALQGMITGVVLLLGFALPPLLQLKNVPALHVLRRDVGMPRQNALAAYGVGAAALCGLLIWQAGDAKLGLYVFGGFVAAFAGFGAIAYVALHALARLAAHGSATWRYGLASLRRRGRSNSVQVLSLSLGLMAILLLAFTRNDLIEAWRNRTPPDAPNRFVLNIQPEQRAPVAEFFNAHGVAAPEVYPMVRGRLMAINGKAVNAEDYAEQRTRRLVEREFNLSYMSALPAHNSVAAGRWFSDPEADEISVETGIAERLGIEIGDELTWQVAGEQFKARVSSLRRLDWDSMRVNFFVVATPRLLENYPTTYLTSFHLPAEQAGFVHELTRAYTNLTVVDTTAILRQAMSIMERVVAAVQFVFVFALVAGVLVLYAAMLATEDERLQEAAVMRALGATRAQVAAMQRAEFLAVGLLAGTLAALGATAIGYILATQVFQLRFEPNGWVLLAGPLIGLLCVALNTVTATRRTLAQPPIAALREV